MPRASSFTCIPPGGRGLALTPEPAAGHPPHANSLCSKAEPVCTSLATCQPSRNLGRVTGKWEGLAPHRPSPRAPQPGRGVGHRLQASSVERPHECPPPEGPCSLPSRTHALAWLPGSARVLFCSVSDPLCGPGHDTGRETEAAAGSPVPSVPRQFVLHTPRDTD